MDIRTQEQIKRVHGKDGIGRYENRTGNLIDRYNNRIDIWGILLDKWGTLTGNKTPDSNY